MARHLTSFLLIAPAPALRVLVPLYVFPQTASDGEGGLRCTSDTWASVALGGSNVVAVVNPDSGPVAPARGEYAPYIACMRHLHASGVSMVGYVKTKEATETSPGVWTQTGMRDAADVAADLQLYAESYEDLLEGIFVDEVANRWSAVSNSQTWFGDSTTIVQRYLSIFAAVRSFNWTIWANPGSAPPDALVDGLSTGHGGLSAGDVFVLYEGGLAGWDPTRGGADCIDTLWTDSQGEFGPGPWCKSVPNWDGVDAMRSAVAARSLGSEAAALIYGVSDGRGLGGIINQSRAAGIGLLYVTDQPMATPWSALSGIWCSLLSQMDSECGTCAPPPASCTPSPPALPPLQCQNWCAGHAADWATKCAWSNQPACWGCEECTTPPPASPPRPPWLRNGTTRPVRVTIGQRRRVGLPDQRAAEDDQRLCRSSSRRRHVRRPSRQLPRVDGPGDGCVQPHHQGPVRWLGHGRWHRLAGRSELGGAGG